MLPAILSALAIQGDKRVAIDTHTPIQDILSLLHTRVETDNTAFNAVLGVTFQIFNAIKAKPFESVAAELKRCASIAGVCATHIQKKHAYQALFIHALDIQEFYLDRNKRDREALVQYVATRDSYAAIEPDIFASGIPDKFLDLFDNPDTAAVLTMVSQGKASRLKLSDIEAPRQNVEQSNMINDSGSLRVRLEQLQIQSHSSHKRKTFVELEKDTLDHVYALKRLYPLASNTSYSVEDPLIQDLQLALEIQAAHISYLKTQKNTFKLSKALQKAAFLFRTLDAYYQRSDASEALRNNFRESVHFIQGQSVNIKSITTCGHVETSEQTSPTEKARAKEKRKERVFDKEVGLTQICSMYQTIIGADEAVHSAVPPYAVTVDAQQMLSNEFSMIQASVPTFSFYPLFTKVSAYLSHVLMNLAPQADAPLDYLHYADDNNPDADSCFPDEVMDISQSVLANIDNAEALSQLLQALELYYATKIACLEEERFAPVKFRSDDLVLQLRFISEVRLGFYRYLLTPLATQNLSQIKQDCDHVLNQKEGATPLIHALAEQRLAPVNNAIQAQLLVEMNAASTANEIAEATPKQPLTKSAKKRLKARRKAEKKVAEAQSSALTIWEGVQQNYEHTTLSAPGWMACREEVIASLEAKDFANAADLLDEWIDSVKDKDIASSLLIDKGMFDGYLHKAILLRCLNRHNEAMFQLGLAWQHLAPEETQQKTRNYQKQKMMLEKGLIYMGLKSDGLASVAFSEANRAAEANDTLCFYIIYQELMSLKDSPREALSQHQEAIKRLIDISRPVFVDEYSRPYFYQYCNQLASITLQEGAELLKQANAAKALGQSDLKLEIEGKIYVNQSIQLQTLLLEYSKEYSPNRVIEFEMKLAINYRTLRAIMPQRNHLKLAHQHLDNALKIARRNNQQDFIALVYKERSLLGRALTFRKATTEQAIEAQSQQKYLALCEAHYNTYLKHPVQEIGDVSTNQIAMIEAIKRHTMLAQVKNMLRVFNRFTPAHMPLSPRERGLREKIEQRVVNITLKEVAETAKYLGLLTGIFQTELEEAPKEASTPNALVQLYVVESHYLANVMRMLYDQKIEGEMKLNTPKEELRLAFSIQATKVETLASRIRAYERPDSIIDEDIVPQFLAAHAADINLDISASDLEAFGKMDTMPDAFKAAVQRIDKKQFWVALFDLFTCAKDIKDKKSTVTARQEAIVHFLTAKIIHWFLELMASELFSKMEGTEEQDYFEKIFKALKIQCCAEFKKARQNGFVEGESITNILNDLKELVLPEDVLVLKSTEDNACAMK